LLKIAFIVFIDNQITRKIRIANNSIDKYLKNKIELLLYIRIVAIVIAEIGKEKARQER